MHIQESGDCSITFKSLQTCPVCKSLVYKIPLTASDRLFRLLTFGTEKRTRLECFNCGRQHVNRLKGS